MDVPTGAEAETALADARTARVSLVAAGLWFRTYLLVFAAASVLVVLLIGLGGQSGRIIGTTLWICLVAAMSWWAARQRVVLRGYKRCSIVAFGGWGLLYGATLLLGEYLFTDDPAFWVPAAVVTAIPLVLVARSPLGPIDWRRSKAATTSDP